ncbi:MAG: FimB/Mfa2 family fimbrial subunit [Muribaculaceae bacterium]|nr:FimB/Mfa2 family fimbrial subunit [Muribaculaceae bacterium]MDE5957862.1 FimB/Mfa2 family fimbrial subunit [Muribaculaceae bacterium]MDE6446936.1 FimB/Mfa2 family fimbrial subunit [Muribaculaceae bacterium]
MKRIIGLRKAARPVALATAAVALLTSCSMIHEDLPECATRPETRASVNFIYDYNTQEQDLFAQHVGSVTLYVFDKDGRFLQQSEHTAAEIRTGNLQVPLSLPYGEYRLYASARASEEGYEASLLTPGAKFRKSALAIGDADNAGFLTLDNTNGLVDHQSLPLEDQWISRQMTPLIITEAPMPAEGAPQPPTVVVEATVPMQRITNTLHLTITRGNAADANLPALSASDYEVSVQTRTGRHELDLLGRPTAAATPLTYTPWAYTTTRAAAPSLQADIAMSRLMLEEDAAQHTRLVIRSRLSGEVFEYDLPTLLATSREAYPGKEWTAQEYLDREYDYNLAVEFTETDDGWRYIQVSIPILNWSKRIQNVEL